MSITFYFLKIGVFVVQMVLLQMVALMGPQLALLDENGEFV